VITAHRVKKLKGVRECTHFHLSDPSPFDLIGVRILFITGDLTTMTTHTGSCVKVKTVLFTLTKLRQVYAVVTTLHTGIGFMLDEIL
jgi:hypothetical protein